MAALKPTFVADIYDLRSMQTVTLSTQVMSIGSVLNATCTVPAGVHVRTRGHTDYSHSALASDAATKLPEAHTRERIACPSDSFCEDVTPHLH